jgi:hypothetical protein
MKWVEEEFFFYFYLFLLYFDMGCADLGLESETRSGEAIILDNYSAQSWRGHFI